MPLLLLTLALILSACGAEVALPADLDVGRSVCSGLGETGIGAGPSAVTAWECWPDGGCAELDLTWDPAAWDYVAQCTPGNEIVAVVAW